jgi:hypothetical protein
MEKKMITEKQKNFINKLLEDRIVLEETVYHIMAYERQFKNRIVDLTKNVDEFSCYEASVFIDMLLNECESRKAVAKRDENMKKGLEKYERLLQFAKDNKVKGVRNMMKKGTIMAKCKEVGLEIPQELI